MDLLAKILDQFIKVVELKRVAHPKPNCAVIRTHAVVKDLGKI